MFSSFVNKRRLCRITMRGWVISVAICGLAICGLRLRFYVLDCVHKADYHHLQMTYWGDRLGSVSNSLDMLETMKSMKPLKSGTGEDVENDPFLRQLHKNENYYKLVHDYHLLLHMKYFGLARSPLLWLSPSESDPPEPQKPRDTDSTDPLFWSSLIYGENNRKGKEE